MIDFHLHTKFSHDGRENPEDIVSAAKEKGITHMAITDHCDWDYLDIKGYWFLKQIKLKKYLAMLDEISKYEGISVAKGIELGFSGSAARKYIKEMPFERFDYIVNSAHTACGEDVYFEKFFKDKDRKTAYTMYLGQVEKSVDAPYPYNTVAHIGYVAKNAPYPSPALLYDDFPEEIDRILKKIIDKDKTLEVNSNLKRGGFMPDDTILRRYRQLGGDNIIFGSDAHKLCRLGEKYDEALRTVKDIGFTHWTVYCERLPERIPL